ncbi:MAG TPA: His-Xaa-Ser system radical SAM maturase HxsB [Elusimicrobiales bacterium]|nr:His-Xaa-Ser system radical SAM maturase HxsB [Elusimicrobiales bacterium]HOL62840.1 His-Xaa-Ser system radical SAM maturase HxsB [Elusimicrobiales bacterium]HPO96098.1 His-Xaa-Ser system radical SAM maturase HxsB [Elusimicrobiales bacterium]
MKKFYFNFKKIKNKYLITDDAGNFQYLSEKEFNKLSKDHIDRRLAKKLEKFNDNLQKIEDIKNINSSSYKKPGLHIMVISVRCNHSCVYCQASAKKEKADMSYKTAKKSIDFALGIDREGLAIEFQGGEPLINWIVLKKAVEYAREKARKLKKDLELGVVTNLSLMDERKADFLIKNNVYLCTSLDGPEFLHNSNRIYTEGNSYKKTVRWIKYFNKKAGWRKINGKRVFYPRPNALLTVTSESLNYPKEIIDEYVKLNLRYVFARPLMPFGYASDINVLKKISYTSKDFIIFYKKLIDYILYLNMKGTDIKERTLRLFLTKIIKKKDSNYLDLRSPCGAAIGQIAYNYNGEIYTCDEARMLAARDDDFFLIGNVYSSKYSQIISAPQSRLCTIASNLENQHVCFRCVYKPYCGICPVYNYLTQKNPWGNQITNFRCEIYKGILDYAFELIRDKKILKIFEKWVENDYR